MPSAKFLVLLLCSVVLVDCAYAVQPTVAAGNNFSLLLSEDGSVHAIGSNDSGQLGTGTTFPSDHWVAVQATNVRDIIAISAGNRLSVALRRDGTVWIWGLNTYGQLGDGTTIGKSLPIQVTAPGFGDIVAIAAGGFHVVAVQRDGTLWTWGYNFHGEVGDGTHVDRHQPYHVGSIGTVVQVAAGYFHSLALLSDGSVKSWGYNVYGQLGDNTVMSRSTPVPVFGLSNVTKVATGGYHSLALTSDGKVMTWGYNPFGALGDGTTTNRSTPVQVQTAASTYPPCPVGIAGGSLHSLLVTCSGAVYGWGRNLWGELGDGTTGSSSSYAKANSFYSSATGVIASPTYFMSFVSLPQSSASVYGAFQGFGFDGDSEIVQVGSSPNCTTIPTDVYVCPTPVDIAYPNPGAKLGKRTNFRNSASPSDVFWRKSDGTNVIWDYTSASPTGFSANVLPGVDTSWTAVATVDITGDGISDVVWLQASTGTVAVWIMASPSAVASVTFPASVGPGSPWRIQAVGDMDGDSYGDILWRNNSTGEVLIWYMKPDGTIDQALSLGIVPLSWEVRAIADVDGDWIKDIVWFQPSTGQVAIWNMHINGTYSAWFPLSVGASSGWDIYRVGDFDGDGREDLFWRHTNGTTAVSYLNGPTVAATQFLFGVPLADWSVQAIGDYDGDGREDLLWYSSAGQVIRWRMQGRAVSPVVESIIGIGTGWQTIQ